MTARGDASKRRGEAGFSLIETVVAVAVIGLLSLVIFEVARFTRASYVRGQEASEAFRHSEAARGLLAQLFSSVELLPVEDRKGRRAVFFDGGSDRLTLVAPYTAFDVPGARGAARLASRPGLAVISLGLEARGAEGEALVLRHTPLSLSGGALDEAEALELSPPPATLIFRYFGPERDGGGGGRAWREEWRMRGTGPRAVSITFQGPGLRSSGPLVLRLGRDPAEELL